MNEIQRGRRELVVGLTSMIGLVVLLAVWTRSRGSASSGMTGSILVAVVLSVIAYLGAVWALRVLSVWMGITLLSAFVGLELGARGSPLATIVGLVVLLANVAGLARLWRSSDVAAFMTSQRTAVEQTSLDK